MPGIRLRHQPVSAARSGEFGAHRLVYASAAGVAPIRYFPDPHTAQVAFVAGRPFFMTTPSIAVDPVLALHLTQ
jgi:hypothetical protein